MSAGCLCARALVSGQGTLAPHGLSAPWQRGREPRRRGADGFACRVVATTQMQAPDARKAFPCFDEPAMKAVFTVTMIHPSDHKAISNMPANSEWGGGALCRVGGRAAELLRAPCRHLPAGDGWAELERHPVQPHAQDVHLPAGLHRQPV